MEYGATKVELIASKVNVPLSPLHIVLPVKPFVELFGSALTVSNLDAETGAPQPELIV